MPSAAVCPAAVPPSSDIAFVAHAGLLFPAKYGTPLEIVGLKLPGFPKKSQRSTNSPVPLTSVPASIGPHGCAPYTLMIVFTCQPSSACANDFLLGIAYVSESVKRLRMSKSLLAYSPIGFALFIGSPKPAPKSQLAPTLSSAWP